jgi:hypothetical protein
MARSARRGQQRDPFEVDLGPEDAEDLVGFLAREIDYAEMARIAVVGDNDFIDDGHVMYEGGDTLVKNTPWPGAANLGSFIVTEKVDAMRARIMATLFADPVWIVEGWGDAADNAPFVEAFHQAKSEQEKLQQFLSRVAHNSLIEGTGVLEVSDRIVMRKSTDRIAASVVKAPDGSILLGEDGQPQPIISNGIVQEEQDPNAPALQMAVSRITRATAGPSFRVLSLKNFFFLPGHATEREDVWGYAKRFFRRLPDLEQRERDGYYRNVAKLGLSDERLNSGAVSDQPRLLREGQQLVPAYDRTAEKEIWEITFLGDLDHDGFEEWYIATFSKLSRVLLRVQYQDYGTPHYCFFCPFPRPNSIYGYSYAINKLGSIYDEHASLRNMFADRCSLATSAPFLQVEGSTWNPALKPFGPRKVIPVRDINELQQLEIRDVPQSVTVALQQCLQAAERLSGQNDTSTGQLAQQDRTLGEVKLVTEQSFVRIDEIVKNFQEGMEDLFDLHQIIWKNKLEALPEPMPGSILASMLERGIQIDDKTITASMLDGAFRGKPHGSVQSADYTQMRSDFNQMLTALTQLSQSIPALHQHLNDPKVIRSIVSQIARVYGWPDRANLLGGFTGQAQPMPPASGTAGGTNMLDVQMKNAELAANSQLQIQLKTMDNAKAIEVARIMASQQPADPQDEGQEEQQATGMQIAHEAAQAALSRNHETQQNNADRMNKLAEIALKAHLTPKPPKPAKPAKAKRAA